MILKQYYQYLLSEKSPWHFSNYDNHWVNDIKIPIVVHIVDIQIFCFRFRTVQNITIPTQRGDFLCLTFD